MVEGTPLHRKDPTGCPSRLDAPCASWRGDPDLQCLSRTFCLPSETVEVRQTILHYQSESAPGPGILSQQSRSCRCLGRHLDEQWEHFCLFRAMPKKRRNEARITEQTNLSREWFWARRSQVCHCRRLGNINICENFCARSDLCKYLRK